MHVHLTTVARRPAPAPARSRPARPEPHGFGFGLFLVVNAVLFLRPSDFVPGMLNLELYQYAILGCLLVSFPAILEHFQPKKMESRPIDLCVLMLLPAVLLSHVTHADLDHAWADGLAFFKIVVYYLLFASLVTTPRRLYAFIVVFALCAAGVAVLGMLDFHRAIRLPRLKDALGREAVEDPTRMYGPGIFQDPNDVGLLLITAGLLLLAVLSDKRLGLIRWLGLVPLALYGYGFFLTQSRGGVLALGAGLGVLFVLRFGWQRGFLLGLLIAPALATFFMTRQADLSSHQDTGQTRIQLWNEGLVMFRANPIFGVGANRYNEEAGQVAHNSYMHAFGELGFFGGVFFLAATLLSLEGLYRLRQPYLRPGGGWMPRAIVDPDMAQLFPFVAAATVAYAAGMFTLTLNYMVMTYTVFGMASLVIATARTSPPQPKARFDLSLWVRMGVCSVAFLVFMFCLVRALFRA